MPPASRVRGLLALLGAALVLLAFRAVGEVFLDGYALDLGSVYLPRPRTMAFLALWSLFGLAAAALAVAGLEALRGGRRWTPRLSDRGFVAAAALLALLVPALLRAFVLLDRPLADDESAYRFMAQLLAEGRLWAPSEPEGVRIFLDRAFMVNDGRFHAGYFVGWPALMVPALLIGVPGYANALYSALAVPPLFLLARRLAGRRAARLATALALLSPLLMVGAATELAHTSCFTALAWTAWAATRAGDRGAAARWSALAAVAFSIAFFVRPASALGIGLPWLVAWLRRAWREPEWRGRRLAAFALPAAAFAVLFLAVNAAHGGGPLTTAYDRLLDFQRENGYRFASVAAEDAAAMGNFRFDGLAAALASAGAGVFRLSFALFGWPSSFLLAACAAGARGARLPAVALALFAALHLFVADPGIDSFGPVHWFETALPLLLLTALGARRLAALGRRLGGARGRPLALARALGPALALVALVGYLPPRLAALQRIAHDVDAPFAAVGAAGLTRAVVFAPRPFTPQCLAAPSGHFVFFRPNNDPALAADVLWVNHLSLEEDRRLMAARFPDRRGWLLRWLPGCRAALLPLDELPPGAVPDGLQVIPDRGRWRGSG